MRARSPAAKSASWAHGGGAGGAPSGQRLEGEHAGGGQGSERTPAFEDVECEVHEQVLGTSPGGAREFRLLAGEGQCREGPARGPERREQLVGPVELLAFREAPEFERHRPEGVQQVLVSLVGRRVPRGRPFRRRWHLEPVRQRRGAALPPRQEGLLVLVRPEHEDESGSRCDGLPAQYPGDVLAQLRLAEVLLEGAALGEHAVGVAGTAPLAGRHDRHRQHALGQVIGAAEDIGPLRRVLDDVEHEAQVTASAVSKAVSGAKCGSHPLARPPAARGTRTPSPRPQP